MFDSSMAYDPYHRWLGIPPEHQPPDDYRLLGLERFEDGEAVIRHAVERQPEHVRRYQLGQHAADSQRILNELARAKARLLDKARKEAYDRTLRDASNTEVPGNNAVEGQTRRRPVSRW